LISDQNKTVTPNLDPGYRAPGLERAPSWLIKHRRLLIIGAHLVAFTTALWMAFLILHDMRFQGAWFVTAFPAWLTLVLAVKLLVFGLCHQYHGWWRYVGVADLLSILNASVLSTLSLFLLWELAAATPALRPYLPTAVLEISRGVLVADGFATVMILSGMRLWVRLYHEEFRAVPGTGLKRFLIVGAGDAGESLLREIQRMPVTEYDVIGFIDDDPAKHRTRIHGRPVLGGVGQLPALCMKHRIDEIAIAMPAASQQQLRRVVQVCEGAKIRFRKVPSLTDIASGRYRVSQIRSVDINDLLGREAIRLDLDFIRDFVQGKTILITGAGGSIGSEMCRQMAHYQPCRLVLVEQAENPLFHIDAELRRIHPGLDIAPVICDITDEPRVDTLFKTYHPEVVIHAAAHKHVPLMELNGGEAVKNNVLGTRTVADAADLYRVAHFVMISTDKAVNPTSIMGASKRIAEMYIQDLDRTSDTDFVTVRFGNVLGSAGSVVPIFKQQIARGGPVTVTHPQMQRYFMTIPEASQLVLQAATMGQGGEIFVLDMGEPVKIVDLAKELITLSGFRVGEDIEISFTGLRPGEKLFEELHMEGEDMQRTRHEKIHIWRTIPFDRQRLDEGIRALIHTAQTQDREKLGEQIRRLVPEYSGELASEIK
jgi:FlaA1/EpsC-like NDP-sugar epimerase